MKKHLMVVLISVDDFLGGRKIAERIENQEFKNPAEVLSEIKKLEGKKQGEYGYVAIYPISDFMDACNNQEIELEGVWVSYVYVEKCR